MARRVHQITILRDRDLEKINTLNKKSSESAMVILPKLYAQPIVNVALVQKWTGFTRAGAKSVVDRFIDMGILAPRYEDKKYNQSYIYHEYITKSS